MPEALEVAKIFVTGRSQAVRLPKSCRFEGTEVFARRVGNTVVLSPKSVGWQVMWDAVDEFHADADFTLVREPQTHTERAELFA
jgi:antitoxin VapB